MCRQLRFAFLVAAVVVSCIGACQRRSPTQQSAAPVLRPPAATAFYADTFSRRPSAAELTALGRLLFFDPSLSASGRMACASCHDPRFAYGPPNNLAVQPGGKDLRAAGIRAVPSLRYVQNVPPFSEHHFDEAVDESQDQGPTGGHTWDGRADTVHDQALLPLLSRFEMANESAAAVVARVRERFGDRFREVFGATVFDDPMLAFKAILMALEVFQQNPADFYPFDSRYDAWLRGQPSLSRRELRGLALFNDPAKGNCASCHPSQIRQGSFPQFTDFGYAALGVPRNRSIPANRDAGFFDLGLCGPEREDLRAHDEYCGLFRVPTLRNVALRRVFFHNGAFHSLRQVIEFYVQRDLQPAKWYPMGADHRVRLFDDLPQRYRVNISHEPPFNPGGRQLPALNDTEVDDLVAFLQTLTDASRPTPR